MGLAGYAVIAAVVGLGGIWAWRRRPANRRAGTRGGDGTVGASDSGADRQDDPDGPSDAGGDGGGSD